MDMMIIDAHCHYGPGDGLVGPWDTRASLRKYVQWAKASGITHTVLFAAFHSDYAKANHIVAQMVRRYPTRFSGFAFVHPIRDRGRIFPMIKKAVQDYGFLGIKVHRHDAHISREICEAARAFNLPVLYDVMGKVETVELFAREYPSVNFIIPHLGSFAGDWRAQLSFIPLLERHANVYTDTSGVRRFDLLEMAVQRGGAQKVLFGSDGPWLHPGVELAKIKVLNLNREAKKLVLSGNFIRLTRKVRKKGRQKAPLKPRSKRINDLYNSKDLFSDPWLLDDGTSFL